MYKILDDFGELSSKKGEILSRICGFGVQHRHQLPKYQHSLLTIMRQRKLQKALGKMMLAGAAVGKITPPGFEKSEIVWNGLHDMIACNSRHCVPRNPGLFVEIKVKTRLRRQVLLNLLKIYLAARCELLCLQ